MSEKHKPAESAQVTFPLPALIANLVKARNQLRDHYAPILGGHHVAGRLTFTLDGNLVGDLGEALAVELFGITLDRRGGAGVDGTSPDGRSVQVKVTTTGGGPAFRQVPDATADHLLFFDLDLDKATGTVVFNGPQAIALKLLPEVFHRQRSLNAKQIRKAAAQVTDDQRLPMVPRSISAA
ncbi:DUF6998 domain-containing protein [Sphingomonas bacterium]|uniref:DUF6998 domain-containing protein n=1 Tax=Sphingomonas bacterium TaxID=1895847 RepID=UPI001575E9F9|nr:hypothetical protein [Sphingomonas bacterium]